MKIINTCITPLVLFLLCVGCRPTYTLRQAELDEARFRGRKVNTPLTDEQRRAGWSTARTETGLDLQIPPPPKRRADGPVKMIRPLPEPLPPPKREPKISEESDLWL